MLMSDSISEREYYTFKGIKYDVTFEDTNPLFKHGGPFDRGGADSYYQRGIRPHYYVLGTGKGDRTPEEEMTEQQVQEYHAGYYYNEEVTMSYKEY